MTATAARPAIISPAAGSTLPGSSATAYALWIGRKPGGYDLYAGAEGTNLSMTVSTLPTGSVPVYMTL